MSNRIDIDRLLVEMRSLKAQTQAFRQPGSMAARDVISDSKNPSTVLQSANKTSFGDVFHRAINQVNDAQQTSAGLAKAYEQGQPGVDLSDVMIASEKAGVSFQAMLHVRNKLVDAYRDVMNMPI